MTINRKRNGSAISVFFAIYLFSQNLIYAVFALFGTNAADYNNMYYIALGIIATIISIYELLINHVITGKSLLIVSLLVVIILHYFLCVYGNRGLAYLPFFIIWGVIPSIFVISLNTECFVKSVKYIEVVNLIQSIACIVATLRYFLAGNRIVNYLDFGGGGYGHIAYTAATCVGISLYYLFACDSEMRLSAFRSKCMNIIYAVLIILSSFAILLSGGRGGAVVMIVYIILFLWILNHSMAHYYTLTKRMLMNIAVVAAVLFIAYYSSKNDIILGSISRTFSYISQGRFDIGQTSGRDVVYSQAIEKWLESPIIGFGPMNYEFGFYPHNLFLDLLLSGGIIALIIGLILFVIYLDKLINSFKYKGALQVFSVISISTVVHLMFSGTFYTDMSFWMLFVLFMTKIEKSTKQTV